MNDQTPTKISALIDEELQGDELERLSREISENEELRRLYGNYQLIGDAMRGEKVDPRFSVLADRIRDQLAYEPTILAPPMRTRVWRNPWFKPVVSLAAAASVLTATVLTLPGKIGPQVSQPLAGGERSGPPVVYVGNRGTHWDLQQPNVESQLNGYLVNHRNRAPAASMQGMIPYASFVAYDQER